MDSRERNKERERETLSWGLGVLAWAVLCQQYVKERQCEGHSEKGKVVHPNATTNGDKMFIYLYSCFFKFRDKEAECIETAGFRTYCTKLSLSLLSYDLQSL